MKNSIIKSILFITMLLQLNISNAQIRGNGKIIVQEIEVVPFETVHINFPIIVEIDANAAHSLVITTDDNILPNIVLENKNNKLSILQDEWIQPTQMVKVKIGTKGLTTLETGGYGNTKVYNLNEEKFQLINTVGKVTLEGQVNKLDFNIETGELDASKLVAQHVNAKIQSHGEATINVIKSLEGKIEENGKLVFLEKPELQNIELGEDSEIYSLEMEKAQKEKVLPIKYVNVKLKNNRFTRIHTQVKGPKNRKFGYGMPFNPGQKRAERYPIGTQIFKVNKMGMKKLLVTIKAEDDGQVVKLFSEE